MDKEPQFPETFNVTITSTIDYKTGDILIERLREVQQTKDLISSTIIHTEDEAVRDALIRLGWTPPAKPVNARKLQTGWHPCDETRPDGTVECVEFYDRANESFYERITFCRKLPEESWDQYDFSCHSFWRPFTPPDGI